MIGLLFEAIVYKKIIISYLETNIIALRMG